MAFHLAIMTKEEVGIKQRLANGVMIGLSTALLAGYIASGFAILPSSGKSQSARLAYNESEPYNTIPGTYRNYIWNSDSPPTGDPIPQTASLSVTGNIKANGVYYRNGIPGMSATCGAGMVLKNAIVSGGIVTSGTCMPDEIGAGTTLWEGAAGQAIYPAQVASTRVGIGLNNPSAKFVVNAGTANPGNGNDAVDVYANTPGSALSVTQNSASYAGYFTGNVNDPLNASGAPYDVGVIRVHDNVIPTTNQNQGAAIYASTGTPNWDMLWNDDKATVGLFAHAGDSTNADTIGVRAIGGIVNNASALTYSMGVDARGNHVTGNVGSVSYGVRAFAGRADGNSYSYGIYAAADTSGTSNNEWAGYFLGKLETTQNLIVGGNIGIGTQAPTSRLHVALNAGESVTLGNPSVASSVHMTNGRLVSDQSRFRIQGQSLQGGGLPISLEYGQTEVMRIGNGNVGIGTTTPTGKFVVNNGSGGSGGSGDAIAAFAGTTGSALYAQQTNPSGYAGYFSGRVLVSGPELVATGDLRADSNVRGTPMRVALPDVPAGTQYLCPAETYLCGMEYYDGSGQDADRPSAFLCCEL